MENGELQLRVRAGADSGALELTLDIVETKQIGQSGESLVP